MGSGVGGAAQVGGDGTKIDVRVDSFVVEFSPQEGEQIEQRGTGGFATPLGERREAVGSVRTELKDASKHDHAVAGNGEGWLARNTALGRELRLTDTEDAFLFAMIDFDLPAVQIDLKKLTSGTFQVRA